MFSHNGIYGESCVFIRGQNYCIDSDEVLLIDKDQLVHIVGCAAWEEVCYLRLPCYSILPLDVMLNAVYAVVVCPSVCLSVTLRYCIKTHDSSVRLVF